MKKATFAGRILKLRVPGFSGLAAVLDLDRGARAGTLISGTWGSGKNAVVLDQARGVWELSIPFSAGRVRFRPQIRTVVVEKAGKTQLIGFDQAARLRLLGLMLRRDRIYRDRSLAFFVAAGRSLIRAEKRHGMPFPLLDDPGHGRKPLRDDPTLRRLAMEIDDDDGPRGGWVGVDVPCFIACMRECEEDVSWYEIWMHVYCLARCAIHCGTGGSPL